MERTTTTEKRARLKVASQLIRKGWTKEKALKKAKIPYGSYSFYLKATATKRKAN